MNALDLSPVSLDKETKPLPSFADTTGLKE